MTTQITQITQINLYDLVTKEKDFIREKKLVMYDGKLNQLGRISICLNNYSKNENIPDLITNPVIIIELIDEKIQEWEFDLKNIIKSIELTVGGSCIDRVYEQQILMYQKIYGLEITSSDSKISFPIPIQAMLEKFGGGLFENKKKLHETRIMIYFGPSLSICSIKSIGIEYDTIKVLEPVDYNMILLKNIENELEEKSILNSHSFYMKKEIFNQEDELDPDKNFFVKIKQNQFYGEEEIHLGQKLLKHRLCFNHPVLRLYFYFGNSDNMSTLYKSEPFDSILFQANGYDILEYSYEQVVTNTKKVKNIPDGIYVVDWFGNVESMYTNMSKIDKIDIVINNLAVPKYINFYICAESINYCRYYKDMYGLMYAC